MHKASQKRGFGKPQRDFERIADQTEGFRFIGCAGESQTLQGRVTAPPALKIVGVAREAREKMLKWKSKIEGNASKAREAARKVVHPEIELLDELAAELPNGEALVPGATRKGPGSGAGLFGRPSSRWQPRLPAAGLDASCVAHQLRFLRRTSAR